MAKVESTDIAASGKADEDRAWLALRNAWNAFWADYGGKDGALGQLDYVIGCLINLREQLAQMPTDAASTKEEAQKVLTSMTRPKRSRSKRKDQNAQQTGNTIEMRLAALHAERAVLTLYQYNRLAALVSQIAALVNGTIFPEPPTDVDFSVWANARVKAAAVMVQGGFSADGAAKQILNEIDSRKSEIRLRGDMPATTREATEKRRKVIVETARTAIEIRSRVRQGAPRRGGDRASEEDANESFAAFLCLFEPGVTVAGMKKRQQRTP